MKALLENFARALVDEPARVHVDERTEDGVVFLDLEVAEPDRGKVSASAAARRTPCARSSTPWRGGAGWSATWRSWTDGRTPFADLVAIGRVVTQGRKGEVLVERSPTARTLPVPRRLRPGPGGGSREVRVESCWPTRAARLKLEGVGSIDEAEQYRGLELRIGEEEWRPCFGSYYITSSRPAGRGHRRAALGVAADLMETRRVAGAGREGAGGELLIPWPSRSSAASTWRRTHGRGRARDARCWH